MRWWYRRFPSWNTCWYARCGGKTVGYSRWCREHTDRILAHESITDWPLSRKAHIHALTEPTP